LLELPCSRFLSRVRVNPQPQALEEESACG
jgi:hypothetical protein